MTIFIARPGQQMLGPFDLATVNAKLATGELLPGDLAWKEGTEGWLPLSTITGVVVPEPGQVPPAPPLPVPQPPQGAGGYPTQNFPPQQFPPQNYPQGGYPQPGFPQPHGGYPAQPYHGQAGSLPTAFEEEQVVFEVSASPLALSAGGVLATALTCGAWLIVAIPANLSTRYRLTTQRLTVRSGLVAKRIEEIEVYRVRDVTLDQSTLGRMLGFGNVIVHANDMSSPRLLLKNVPNPERIKEQIRNAARQGRRNEGVRPMEYMG